MQRRGPRVRGPYFDSGKWKLEVFRTSGERDTRRYNTQKEAEAVKRALEKQLAALQEVTISEALTQYEDHQIRVKGNKEKPAQAQIRQLRYLLPGDRKVGLFSAKLAIALYDEWCTRLRTDSHRNYLAWCKTFYAWCIKQGWCEENPFSGVQAIGKRHHGKAQLTIDEARKFRALALYRAEEGNEGALAALLALYMGWRASELTQRLVKDVDDNGRRLRVVAGKTEKAKRTLTIPVFLRPLVAKLITGRFPLDPLFRTDRSESGHHDEDWVCENVKRLCLAANVTVITAHGLRGTLATLRAESGEHVDVIAADLGHEHDSTTTQSYVKPGAGEERANARAWAVLEGGKG